MKGIVNLLAGYGLWIQATTAVQLARQPAVTVTNDAKLAARQTASPSNNLVNIAAIVPTESGQIGINPPGPEPTPVNIEAHTSYLTEEGGTTKWIGVDPNYIAVTVVTTTKKGGETAVATITKGVSAAKNGAGGLSILLSPAVKSKLEAIAKQVTPCAGKRRRQNRKRQGGPSCGLADFVQRVGADAELQGSFAEPLTDQVWDQIDEGYESDDPMQDGGWEGDGGDHPAGEDEGYFSDDGEGFFEGAEEGELETLVFSSEEEAVAIGEALSGADAAANVAIWGGSTVTAGSFLAWIWAQASAGNGISNAQEIPAESIHKVTKTKTSSTTTTTSSASCPTGNPPSCDGCQPTSVEVKEAKATGVVNWVCSEAKGNTKGCTCDPKVEDAITIFEVNYYQAILEAFDDLSKSPEQPRIECPGGPSDVPSEFFVNKTSSSFCEEVMKDLGKEVTDAATAYDINGNRIPILKLAKVAGEAGESKRSLFARSPPESSDNYLDYRFYMSYKPGSRDCVVPKEDLCRNAYTELVKSNCGTNHGSAGDRMFYDASVDVGCGKFTWKVEKPEEAPPAPTLGERVCHDKHSQYDVHDGQQDGWSSNGCRWFAAGKTMKAGDKEVYWHPIGPGADYHQNYKISWIDGCETSVAEQNLDSPIEGDTGVTCASLMRANYKSCNNGGAGGYRDAGCLRYDFYVTVQ
ncbi:hypothetical protein CcaCcLH18_02868 [Colletotrichum camelliae]|nr:hypothetical protein CcaCcLH18_02868 [Colletotrichum camelliae]